jgi:hypothetical protein
VIDISLPASSNSWPLRMPPGYCTPVMLPCAAPDPGGATQRNAGGHQSVMTIQTEAHEFLFSLCPRFQDNYFHHKNK